MNSSATNSSHKNLIEMLESSRISYGERPLFGTKRNGIYEWTTYEQFSKKVDALRGGLSSLGVSAGDKVAIICKNTEGDGAMRETVAEPAPRSCSTSLDRLCV